MRARIYSNTITVRTGAELRAAINEAAAREGASASAWVRRALEAVTRQGSASSPPPFTRPSATARASAHG